MNQSIEPLARALDRRAFLRASLATAAGGAALYGVGCGSSDDGDPAGTATPAATATSAGGAGGDITPALLTSEFVAGQQNRFAVGVLDAQNELVREAAVHLRFFTVGSDGSTGTFRGEGDMQFVELNYEQDTAAFYVATTPFDVSGKWGVEIGVTPPGGAESKVQVPFDVLAESPTPALGTIPPASRNDTAAASAGQICTRDPVCGLHDLVIGDVLGKGRPLVVQFSTPAFCETRFCGPVLDVLLSKVPAYRDRIDFVHIEVWQDFQLRQPRPALAEWGLQTEPFTFFMTPSGSVAAKLESVFSEEELESALSQLAAI